ncbi:unnamed protein product [Closterium sp. Yama58-4]|nr:unnamed protein product [Closterium sp. Yama58-4]
MVASGSNLAESSTMARKRQATQRTLMDTRPKPVDVASAQLAIATFFHVCRIAPNVAEHDAFKTMLKKVAVAGTGFTPPGRRLIMGRLLEECKANTDAALKEVKDSWKDVGDIGQLDWAKDTIDRAHQLITTLKDAHWITGVLRKEKALQILKPAGTCFGTNYIALERLQAVRKTLDKLVSSEDWEEYVKGKPKMKDAWDTIIDNEFWTRVGTVLDVLCPVKLLRNVDHNQAVMGKIYDKMFVLEDAVKEALGEVMAPLATIVKKEVLTYTKGKGDIGEQKARDEHELIKAGLWDSAHWWEFNGTDVPHLSKLATRVLKQCVSASPCETNWAVWESIHTARRNSLGAKRLADLVYVSHNYHTVKKLNEDLAKKLVVSGLPVVQAKEEPTDNYRHLDDDDIPDEAYLDGQEAEEPME